MMIIFSQAAKADYDYFKTTSPQIAKRIKMLLSNILQMPFTGMGHPEPLRYGLSGYWSRRIDAEHRLVYRIEGDIIMVASCRYHYDK